MFTIASALCGLSGSPLMLNLARALQGIGGSLMFATSLALLASAYQGADRGTAIGIWGATIGGAVAIGPLVGGVLTEWIGWEAIFYVNVPIGIFAIALTLKRVGESRDPQAGGADWIGTVTFSAALFLLVFGLIRGNAEDWNAQIVACLVGAAVLLIAFVVARDARRGTDVRPRACSASRRSSAPRSPRSCCPRRCSRCSCTSRCGCRTCSATPRSRPACASCRSRSCRS